MLLSWENGRGKDVIRECCHALCNVGFMRGWRPVVNQLAEGYIPHCLVYEGYRDLSIW
jgi:hypothetical protein